MLITTKFIFQNEDIFYNILNTFVAVDEVSIRSTMALHDNVLYF